VAIKVLIVDDHYLIRMALEQLFAGSDDIRVVATCADGSEVMEAAARTEPDVVLMDLTMPNVSGLQATRELRGAQPHVGVIVLTGAVFAGAARAADALGVAGFLLKAEEDPGDLLRHVREVAAGGTAWSSAAAAVLVEERARL
jgi:DNA-binding NarL/FixJ family response regulator